MKPRSEAIATGNAPRVIALPAGRRATETRPEGSIDSTSVRPVRFVGTVEASLRRAQVLSPSPRESPSPQARLNSSQDSTQRHVGESLGGTDTGCAFVLVRGHGTLKEGRPQPSAGSPERHRCRG
jgi:hypothetical protein